MPKKHFMIIWTISLRKSNFYALKVKEIQPRNSQTWLNTLYSHYIEKQVFKYYSPPTQAVEQFLYEVIARFRFQINITWLDWVKKDYFYFGCGIPGSINKNV